MTSPRSVLVIGGTGFIGFHSVQALLAAGDAVTVLCRHPDIATSLFNGRVATCTGDVLTLTTDDYRELIDGHHAVVFAAGVDERARIEGDADDFFTRHNITPVATLCAALADSTVQHAVLLNSIFSWLHQQKPALQLTTHHPYIRSRVAQNDVAHAAVRHSHCVLTTLQVPWVFGHCPHRPSQWHGLVNYVRGSLLVHSIHGRLNVMSVNALAQAIVGACHHPTRSSSLPVGDHNLSHLELMQHIAKCAGRPDARTRLLSDNFFGDLTRLGGFFHDIFGLEGGLAVNHLPDLLLQDIVFDPSDSQQRLHYHGGDWLQAIEDTVQHIDEHSLMTGWRKWLNWVDHL